jgi:hypothetical protein
MWNERIGRAPAGGLINTGGLFFFYISLVYKKLKGFAA